MANLAKIYDAARKKGGSTKEDYLALMLIDLKKAGFQVSQKENTWRTTFTLVKDGQKTDLNFISLYSSEPRSLSVRFAKALKDIRDFIPQGWANLTGDDGYRRPGRTDNAPLYVAYQPECEAGRFYIDSARERQRFAAYLAKKAGENNELIHRREMVAEPQAQPAS